MTLLAFAAATPWLLTLAEPIVAFALIIAAALGLVFMAIVLRKDK